MVDSIIDEGSSPSATDQFKTQQLWEQYLPVALVGLLDLGDFWPAISIVAHCSFSSVIGESRSSLSISDFRDLQTPPEKKKVNFLLPRTIQIRIVFFELIYYFLCM